jgi:hypothetical protein
MSSSRRQHFQRTYPHGDIRYAAIGRDKWQKYLDLTEKVAVYWPLSATSLTLVGYYDTVSAANTAAASNAKGSGTKPKVAVNFWHADWGDRDGGPDARSGVPAWYDEEPAS